ncbi:MAG: lamin tail domain-containing protein [Bacilli bacterium]
MSYFKNLLMVVLLLFTLSACNNNELTYEILINNDLTTEYFIGDEIDFKPYFIIKDSTGKVIPIDDSMIDSSKVNWEQAGTYKVLINYQGIEKEIAIKLNNEILTYSITINENISTSINLNNPSINYKEYFIITDSKGNLIDVLDSMIDSSQVDVTAVGSYTLSINYEGLTKELTLQVVDNTPPVTYTISINDNLSTSINLNNQSINYKEYFIITDSKGNLIDVLDSMIDSSQVDVTAVGSYTLSINYEGLTKELTLQVVDNTPPVTYTISIDDNIPKDYVLGINEIDFKAYFLVKDSLNNVIEVLDDMLDLSNVSLNQVGSFTISITYKDISKELVITITEPESMVSTDLFISEYSEGSSYNKYIEIFNGTGKDIDLLNYTLKLFNHSTIPAQYEFTLNGLLKDGDTYVVYNGAANTTIKNSGNTFNQVISFNGNDPIALYKNDVLIDVVGDLSTPVSEGFDAGGVLLATKDNTIIRKSNVFGPNDTWTPDEWEVLGFEVYDDLKTHSMDYYQKPVIIDPVVRTPDLYISEYFEGNGIYKDSKYIEIYNGLGYDVDLKDYAIELYADGLLDPKFVQSLSGILKDKSVYIVYAPYSMDEIKQKGHLASEVAYFNGRHAISLTKNGSIIDLIGVLGEYPDNTGWMVDATSGTANNTLIRDYQIDSPSPIWISSEWYVCYENYLYDIGQHNIIYEDDVIDDFDILFNHIKNLELDNKGTATSESVVTIKGTVYMDVKNETTLVYITDGKNFIKLYGDKIHNYTSPNQVYEVVGYYKSYLYSPTFEVINPATDITVLRDETPITNITSKEVTLEEILTMKKENFVSNINNGYLQSMLQIKGYLQLDTHNSTKWDYALTTNETYTKNDTQYINNGLYFKNNVEELEDFLIDYEVDLNDENIEIDIFGVIYDWNPNRKNWRLYVSDDLTFDYLIA